ncbi:DUF1648 domain-containing protein [Siminovitchia fortis]|uniref:DUF1648 domain-containing protein n=1 Tax=Siminovitchia fortis TaxID=254758 RepID=UPI0011A14105|nr:DUF1648 domain-containing protein [Siminovitchia fortis]
MQSYNHPKLDIPKSAFEKILDWVGAFVFGGWVIYLLVTWNDLPAKVPGHYDGAGNITRMGSKWELIILPVIAGLLTIFMSFLEKHPEWHNYLNLNENNIEFQYKNSRMMLNVLKNIIVFLFAAISWNMIQVGRGKAESLGIWFLPVFLAAVFIPMIFFIVRSVRHK